MACEGVDCWLALSEVSQATQNLIVCFFGYRVHAENEERREENGRWEQRHHRSDCDDDFFRLGCRIRSATAQTM